MSTNDPDAIRADIERTRAELSDDVNALADEVNPKNMARRQASKVTDALGSAKDKVMGTASDAGSSVGSTVGDAVSSVGDAASNAPRMVRTETRGNPLAAGVIAFEAGEVVIDEARMGITWARFPHLFMNFYVFQYAIGIAAAAALSQPILAGDVDARERYLAFLRAGGSLDPIVALREAGVDMSSPEPIERAFGILEGYVGRLEELVG